MKEYEVVVGLEVHAQLKTNSKLFCGDAIAYGAPPNVQVSPITLGHPGTLPKMNRKAIEFAIKMGLACHSVIEKKNYFARKNYFYPDLPKGYQVSQHTTPICKGGYIVLKLEDQEKKIRLNRIHLEEDAGKSLHDVDNENTAIDFNRAGTPLIEIVSEPDLRSGDEAFAFLSEIRKLVRYLEICDGNMEEGSLRCDANISVRVKGAAALGTKVEVKNLNSMRNVRRAIEIESKRLTGLLEAQEEVMQQTRSFDADAGTTFTIRDKEDADDYRYFAEPDLTPFQLEDAFIDQVASTMPILQRERVNKYVAEGGLSTYDAETLTEEKAFADYYESLLAAFPAAALSTISYKSTANWMLGPVRSWLNEENKTIDQFPLPASKLVQLIRLVEAGQLSFSAAASKLFPALLLGPGQDPARLAEGLNLVQQSDIAVLEPIVEQVLAKFAGKVIEYKKGKKGLLALFVGEVMKQSKGKADPRITNELLIEKLKQ